MARAEAGAGERDELITIEKPEPVAGPAGGHATDWVFHAKHWAKLTPVRGVEAERQGALRNVNVMMFELPRDMTILEDMRIVWSGGPFNITDIRRPPSRALTMIVIGQQGVTQ